MILESFEAECFDGAENRGSYYVWQPQISQSGHRLSYRVSFAFSGGGEIAREAVTIRIPDGIMIERDGSSGDYVEMSLPMREQAEGVGEEILKDIDFAWYKENDQLVIYNFRKLPAGYNGFFEVSYVQKDSSFEYRDSHPGSIDTSHFRTFLSTIDILTADPVSARSEEINVYFDSQVAVDSLTKMIPEKLINVWNDDWGERPADSDDYFYLIWPLRTVISSDTTQPYRLQITDRPKDQKLEVVGYRFYGQSSYSSADHVDDQRITGKRFDYVLTRIRKDLVTGETHWNTLNEVSVTVSPLDGIDSPVTLNDEARYSWNKPVFRVPSGIFKSHKRADGFYRSQYEKNRYPREYLSDLGMEAGLYSRYDLDRFLDGTNNKLSQLDYAVWLTADMYEHTGIDPENSSDPDNFGRRKVKYVITDDEVRIFDEKDGYDSQTALLLESGDYCFDKISYSWYMNDAVLQDDLQYQRIQPTYKDNEKLLFYGKFDNDGQWQLMASHDLKTGNLSKESHYVESFSNGELILKPGCIGWQIVTENTHFSVTVNAVISMSLNSSERIMSFLHQKGTQALGIHNTERAAIYDQDDQLIGTDSEADSDFVTVSQRTSYFSKKLVSTYNDVNAASYFIKWKLDMREKINSSQNAENYLEQRSGIFYDLLPKGAALKDEAVEVISEKGDLDRSEYEITRISDFRGSGQDLLKINVTVPFMYCQVIYETGFSWESLKDYGRSVYNAAAYETGNHDLVQGHPDDGQGLRQPELLAGLDPSCNSDRFVYADTSYDIYAITAASSGLTKKVSDDSGYYADECRTSPNETYSYRLRYQNSQASSSCGLILFDSLESFISDGRSSDFRGTVQSIDVSQITDRGAKPIIYFSTVQDLDIEEHHDLADRSIWKRLESEEQLSECRAIAIDMRLQDNGEDFILQAGESLSAIIHMKAPKQAAAVDGYPRAYNNVYILNSLISSVDGSLITNLIHQDNTEVTLSVTADLRIRKINGTKPDEGIRNVVFRLTGTSDYGTEVDMYATSDWTGYLNFRGIEKSTVSKGGGYVLQEYEAPDSWQLDSSEYRVFIDDTGKVMINGEDYSEQPIVIDNYPRIHGDLKLRKVNERTDHHESLPVSETVFKLSGTSDYRNSVNMIERTDDAGRCVFSNVEKGTYQLTEISCPERVLVNRTVWTVIINDSGHAEVIGDDNERLGNVVLEDGFYNVYDENRWHDLSVIKREKGTGKPLETAQFRLWGLSDSGKEYDRTALSGTNGIAIFNDLEKGTYLLKEIKAPQSLDENGHYSENGRFNYLTDTRAFIVRIDEKGNVSSDGLTFDSQVGALSFENEPLRDKTITIIKKWQDGNRSNDERPIPRIHLSTIRPTFYSGCDVKIVWNDEGFTDSRPENVTAILTAEDGTVIEESAAGRWLKSGNEWNYHFSSLIRNTQNYYLNIREEVTGYSFSATANERTLVSIVTDETGNIVSAAGEITAQLKSVRIDKAKWNTNVLTADNKSSVVSFEHRTDLSWPQIVEKPGSVRIDDGSSESEVRFWIEENEQGEKCAYWASDCPRVWLPDDCSSMFEGFGVMRSVDLNGFLSSNVTSYYKFLYGCYQLEKADFSHLDTSHAEDLRALLFNCRKLTELNISTVDTSSATSLYGMFYGCELLTDIDVSHFVTDKVKSMGFMFVSCKGLTALDLRNFNTSAVTNMNQMFYYCENLQQLDLSSFDTSNVTVMSYMFTGNKKMKSLDLSSFDTGNVNNMSRMFQADPALETIYVSDGWSTSNVTSSADMFRGCLNLPNFDSSVVDVTNAHYGSGGYLTYRERQRTVSSFSGDKMMARKETLNSSDIGLLSVRTDAVEYVSDDEGWIKENDQWIYHFAVEDDQCPYWINEETIDGYECEIMGEGSAMFDPSEDKTFEIVNVSEQNTGSLKIVKQCEDNERFLLTVSLSGSGIHGAQIFSGVIFENGVASVYITPEEPVWLHNLPLGTAYEIKETDHDRYEAQYLNCQGIISADTVIEAVVENNRKADIPGVDVTLEKKVSGRFDSSGTYVLSAGFSGLTAGKAYQVSADDSELPSLRSDEEGNAWMDLNMNDGRKVVFHDLPVGCTYFFYEPAGNWNASYQIIDDNGVGRITGSCGHNDGEYQSLMTRSETADPNEAVRVIFTNEVIRRQKISVRKQVIDPVEGDNFRFTAEFRNLEPSVGYVTDFGLINADDEGRAVFRFSLEDGEQLTISDLPVGTLYRLMEEASAYRGSYQITDDNGRLLQEASGRQNSELTTQWQTVREDQNVFVTFVNERCDRNLVIEKQVAGNIADRMHDFQFIIRLNDEDDLQSVITGHKNGEPITLSYDSNNRGYSFRMKHGDCIQLSLKKDCEFSIEENCEDYRPSVRVESLKKTMEVNGNRHSGRLTDDQKLIFINERNAAIPTGADIGFNGLTLLGVPVITVILMMIMRRMLD